MLYHFFQWYVGGKPGYAHEDPLFRGTLAVVMAFVLVWGSGPRVIRMLTRAKLGDKPEFDHDALNRLTQGKKNTPTMGGILIVAAIIVTTLLLADLFSFYVRMGIFCVVWLALVGAVDDWLKLTADRRMGTRDGLRSWEKLVFQVGLGALLAIFILREGAAMAETSRFTDVASTYKPSYNLLILPFVKADIPLSTWLFVVLTVLVITGTSNAVNLTDGMDGLASGCMVLTAFAFMTLAYVVGNEKFAAPLLFPHIRGAAELSVMFGAAMGACLGFLWYNAYPAQVFMGDTGSLPLGGLMGYVAIVTRMETMLLIVGGVFVIEALSVILQVSYFKYTGGKRIFRCTPIHHHFDLGGWT